MSDCGTCGSPTARHGRPIWEWPVPSWLITGIPAGILGGLLAALALHYRWLTDPYGILVGMSTLGGMTLGALLWSKLCAISYRRQMRAGGVK